MKYKIMKIVAVLISIIKIWFDAMEFFITNIFSKSTLKNIIDIALDDESFFDKKDGCLKFILTLIFCFISIIIALVIISNITGYK